MLSFIINFTTLLITQLGKLGQYYNIKNFMPYL